MGNKELKQENAVVANSLPRYMVAVIATLKKEKKYSAAHNYLSALHSFTRFSCIRHTSAVEDDTSLNMQKVFTPEWLQEYEEWLTAQTYSPNTISTYMRVLQAVYHRWIPLGAANYNPTLFKNVYTKVEARTKRALTVPQMEKLINLDLETLAPQQQRVLAYFLLMFMLRGMPFIDLAHLRKSDLHNGRIIYHRHKTGKLMIVKLPPEAFRLIQKYRDRTGSGYLLPLLNDKLSDNELYNSEELYRHYQDTLRRYNRQLAQLMKHLLPGVPVSSYTARHTWATIAYHSGIPVGIISQSLGHSSIQVTMTYLKPFDIQVIDKVNKQVISLVKKHKKIRSGTYSTLYSTILR